MAQIYCHYCSETKNYHDTDSRINTVVREVQTLTDLQSVYKKFTCSNP